MYGMNYNWQNQMPNQYPYGQNIYGQQAQIPKTSVKRVTGKESVYAYPMAPDSSDLFLDETAPILWLVTTDSSGKKTAIPYTISEYKEPVAPDLSGIEDRLKRLEDMLNAKSDSASTRTKKSES